MVRALDLKMFRDLWKIKLQVISISLVLACGVGALVGFLSTERSLRRAQMQFYRESNFADVFAELKKAPTGLKRRVEAIPGVSMAETRVVKDVLLDIPGRPSPAVGRFISLPSSGLPQINHLYLRQGRLPDPKREDEAVVSEGFAQANRLNPGDSIEALLEGKITKFVVVGTVLSPEFVYTLRSENPIPDDRHFGVVWTTPSALEAAFDMEGSFNSVTLILDRPSSLNYVIERLDQLFLQYGGLGAYGRVDQVSHRFLDDEMNEMNVLAVAIPVIFLVVAAFLLNIVIGRIVGLQRTQIGMLKAAGYSGFRLVLHYFKMAGVIALLGLVLGYGLGYWIGTGFTRIYTDFFRFPILLFSLDMKVVLLATGIGFGASLGGVVFSLRKVLQLPPAEAMRPPVPLNFHKSVWERTGIPKLLSPTGRMIFRNLTFKPSRTFLGIFGIGLAVMITMLGLFWRDTLNHVTFSQYWLAQREDMEVVFNNPQAPSILDELSRLPGVLRAEGYRAVPVRIRHGHHNLQAAVISLPEGAQLRRLLGKDLSRVDLPPKGLLLTQLLARRLAAKPGDLLQIEVLDGKRQKFTMTIGDEVDQWVGYAAYIDKNDLKEAVGEDRISFALLDIDPSREASLQNILKKRPTVAAVNLKREVLAMFDQMMSQFILVFATALTLFALVIAIGVVYNHTRVALSERTWELMSLRVLGFSQGKVFGILATEMAIQIGLALPLGWVMGYYFGKILVQLLHTKSFEIPLIISPPTFAYASVVVVASALASAVLLKKRLDATSLVEALKVRE